MGILEDKERKLREFTEKLLAQIKREKEHINTQHILMKDEAKLNNDVATDQQKVVAETGKAQEADSVAASATETVKAAQSALTEAKANVTKDENAESNAESTLDSVTNKAHEAEEERKETKKESQAVKAEAKEVKSASDSAQEDLKAATEETQEVASTPVPNTTVAVPDALLSEVELLQLGVRNEGWGRDITS